MTAQETTALVFNIQKFSLHDGPGIRTVVFLKGCPLRCQWCSNPESQLLAPQVMHDPNKGDQISGEWKTVEEVLSVCLQDLPFYEESGGGVTLSGGEVLLQADFAVALLQALHDRGVHTAIETTGYAAPGVFDRVTAHADLLLFDIKHWDEAKHMAGTGVSNQLIMQNMARAIAAGRQVLPRLPVIPGYNDSLPDAHGFVERLREVGADQVQLLPFHQFGERKYEMLDRNYAYTNIPALHQEDLQAFQQVFLDAGIRAFF